MAVPLAGKPAFNGVYLWQLCCLWSQSHSLQTHFPEQCTETVTHATNRAAAFRHAAHLSCGTPANLTPCRAPFFLAASAAAAAASVAAACLPETHRGRAAAEATQPRPEALLPLLQPGSGFSGAAGLDDGDDDGGKGPGGAPVTWHGSARSLPLLVMCNLGAVH